MEYKINGKISFDDYMHFIKIHQKSNSPIKIIRIVIAAVLFICMTIYIPISSILKDKSGITPAPLPVLIGIPFFIVFSLFVSFRYRKYIFRKKFYESKTGEKYFNMTIDEQFISTTTETSSSKFTKPDIFKIAYDKDSVYIYIGMNNAAIIKKRFLENEDDFEEMVKFIKENYG